MKLVGTGVIKTKITGTGVIKKKMIGSGVIRSLAPVTIVMACEAITEIDEGYPDTIYSPFYGTIDGGTP